MTLLNIYHYMISSFTAFKTEPGHLCTFSLREEKKKNLPFSIFTLSIYCYFFLMDNIHKKYTYICVV